MGIIEIAIILVTLISIVIAIVTYLKKFHTKIILSIIIIVDIVIFFELCFGTIFTKPIILLNGNENISVEVNTEYNDLGAKAFHHNREITNKIVVQNNVNINKIGTYEVEFSVKIFFTEIHKSRIVNVVDTTSPTLELLGSRDVKIMEGRDFYEDGYLAIDNYDGDITKNVIVEKENVSDTQFKINYKVLDSSNNETLLYRVIDILPKTKPEDINKNGVIYLTFDDGPSLDITPHILDILKEEEIKATFFIINFEGPEQEEIIKRIVSEGHTIGIHGYSHDYATIYASDEAFMNNIKTLQEKIFNLTGVDTKIMRFPGGSSNTISKRYSENIMTRLTQKVITEGYMYYDWNVTSGDSGDVHTAKAVYRNVTRRISKNKSNIVLLHDYSGNNKTLDSLKNIIKYSKKNGYTFEPINENTPLVMHNISN